MYDLLFNWPFLYPFLIKSIVSAVAIGVLGLIIGKFCWSEPEDFE